MDTIIRYFARQMLRKLQVKANPQAKPKSPSSEGVEMTNGDSEEPNEEPKEGPQEDNMIPVKQEESKPSDDEDMEDGQTTEDLVQTPYLPNKIGLPAEKSHVLQHIELLLALSVKVPEFLDQYVSDFFLFIHNAYRIISKDLPNVRRHGHNCSRSYSGSHHAINTVVGLE
jgi:symplekin